MSERHFLIDYGTHNKPEAKQAAVRHEKLTGERVAQDPSKTIKAYSQRLEDFFLNPDLEKRQKGIRRIKPRIYENTLIKPENFPESYFTFQKQQAQEHGLGNVEFSSEEKQAETQKVIQTQQKSLDSWIDYLTGEECKYPADIKLFAIQGVLKLGTFDTDTYEFTKRTKATTASFPEIDREALSIVLGALEAKHYGKPTDSYSSELLGMIDQAREFGPMYAGTMQELDKAMDKESLLPITDGIWRTFPKDSDHLELVDAFAGKRSNLCIADIGAAERYLTSGSLEVYFSNDRSGNPSLPRVAIASAEDRGGVYEVRGTYNKNEDTDPYIDQSDILSGKLKTLPNGESFARKSKDMKQMTAIYNKCFQVDRKTGEKTYLNPSLTKEDLKFLYELDSSIEGFGYDKDPRIKELWDQRDNPEQKEQDMLTIFECTPDQIVHSANEIDENTRAFVGKLEKGIFDKIQQYNLENIYTSFPEGRVRRERITIGGKTKEQLQQEMQAQGDNVGDYAKDMMKSSDFTTQANLEIGDFIRLQVGDLGFTQNSTTDQLYKRAQELGLELCPAETGPNYRLQYRDQPMGEWVRIAMKQITDRGGGPRVFDVGRHEDGLWLSNDWTGPTFEWDLDYQFLFRLRKLET